MESSDEVIQGIKTILSLYGYFLDSINSVLGVVKIEDMLCYLELKLRCIESQNNPELVRDFNFYQRLN